MTIFEFVKRHTDILEVVRHYVHLRLAGSYYKGKCPFHRENDASFTVSPDKGIYYCFGCQATGDAIAFVERIEQKSPKESLETLIDRYNLTVPADVLSQMHQSEESVAQKKSYYSVCQFVARWTHQQLLQDQIALAYVESRGLTRETISRFMLGYMPGTRAGIQKLIKDASRSGILLKDLVTSHIFFESRTSVRSAYEERILFPITDAVGRYCGFGGRIFKPNDNRAKYYNSKDSPFFAKGQLLFGLSHAKNALQEKKNVFLVEGYMDCVSLSQHGYHNVVATLGTACTREHLVSLSRHVHTVYVLFDGDSAGIKAVLRLVELCWDVSLELRVILLPDGNDPASWLQSGKMLDESIAQSLDIVTFMIQQETVGFATLPLSQQLAAVSSLLSVISRVPDPIKQELLLQRVSDATKLSLDALQKKSHSQQMVQQRSHVAQVEVEPEPEKNASLEEMIVAAFVNDIPYKKLTISPDVQELLSTSMQHIIHHGIAFKDAHATATFDQFIQSINAEQKEFLLPLVMRYNESLTQEAFDVLLHKFLHNNWKRVVHNMKAAIADASSQNDSAKMAELMNHFSLLKQRIQEKGLV